MTAVVVTAVHDHHAAAMRSGSWAIRPEAATEIPNLVLAGDYVRTHTDLASMEGA